MSKKTLHIRNEPPDKKRKLEEDLWSDDEEEDLLMSQIDLDAVQYGSKNLTVNQLSCPKEICSASTSGRQDSVLKNNTKTTSENFQSFNFPDFSKWSSSNNSQIVELSNNNLKSKTLLNLKSSDKTFANHCTILASQKPQLDILQQCNDYKKQLEGLKKTIYSHDGESKILRNLLTEKQNEISLLKTENNRQLTLYKQQNEEKDKMLKKLQESFQTQLQFKDNELKQVQNNLQRLEKSSKRSNNTNYENLTQPSQSEHELVPIPVNPVYVEKSSIERKEKKPKFNPKKSPLRKKEKITEFTDVKRTRKMELDVSQTLGISKFATELNCVAFSDLSNENKCKVAFFNNDTTTKISTTNITSCSQLEEESSLNGLMPLLCMQYTHKYLTCSVIQYKSNFKSQERNNNIA